MKRASKKRKLATEKAARGKELTQSIEYIMGGAKAVRRPV